MLACFGEASGMSVIRTKWVRCEGGKSYFQTFKNRSIKLALSSGVFFLLCSSIKSALNPTRE